MRKFTLYQASRYTKISRYKLEQAIEEGFLSCTEGKGNVKCYIMEDDLNGFLETHGEQYRRLSYPDDKQRVFVSEEITKHISKEIHDQLMNEKDRVISLLEFQNEQLMPQNGEGFKSQALKIKELRSIATKAINHIPSEQHDIIDQLNEKLNTL